MGGEVARWSVHFALNGYSLTKGDKIGISFPFGTFLPDNPDYRLITINGAHILQRVRIEKYNFRTYIIELPFDIPDEAINGFYTICGFDETFYVIFEKGGFDLLKIQTIDLTGNEMLVEIPISNH